MAGLFGLSVDSKTYQGKFLEDLFWGTFYHQHLGEEYAGLSTYGYGKISIRTHRGMFRSSFAEDLLGLEGTEGIGYCGPIREPYLVDARVGMVSLCFSGNLINSLELSERFKNFGHTFNHGGNIEIIAKLIVQGSNVADGIQRVSREIKGAYSLLVLTLGGIYAARCPSGHWPLVIGEKKGAVAVASEPGGFSNLGFRLVRDLEPGETILVKDGCWKTVNKTSGKRIQVCSFYWVYTGFPNAVIEKIPASQVRKRLGSILAKHDLKEGFTPDVLIPVPDSGRFHAAGYYREFCEQAGKGRISKIPIYDEILLKYPYAGRSFMPQDQEARDREAQIKLLVSGENFRDKVIVVCDDSIVRGTQTQTNLVPKLRSVGVKEIHLRISNPELRSHCPWGKTTQKGETLVSRQPTIEDRVKYLGVDSLRYNTIDDLVEAIGLSREQLCVDCSLD